MKYKLFGILVVFSAALVLFGCNEQRRYSSIYTENIETAADITAPPTAREVDLVEDLSEKRIAYLESLKTLRAYYEQTGNHQKSGWANRELELFGQSPQYTYIAVGQIASENLRATDSIPEADELFAEARRLYRSARLLALVGDKPKLRQALSMFNELINTYPTSDKIDDAAYKAGVIYQAFGDDRLAVTYYKRAFQWNSDTPYPARFKAARLMDLRLGLKADALELYKYAIENEGRYGANVDFAKLRVEALLNTEEVIRARQEIGQ